MTKHQHQLVTEKHISSLAEELAQAASITPEQAAKVLSVLHIEKLNENVVAYHEVMSNPLAVNALNLSHSEASQRLKVASSDAVTLENLRVGVKPQGASGIMV